MAFEKTIVKFYKCVSKEISLLLISTVGQVNNLSTQWTSPFSAAYMRGVLKKR